MNEDYIPVLQQLAALEGIDPVSLHVEGDVVFRRSGNELIGTVCQIDTPHWNAAKTAAGVLARCQRR